jgi:hypothetical protein
MINNKVNDKKLNSLLVQLDDIVIETVSILKRAIYQEGEHHKVWLINEALKKLMGPKKYNKYMNEQYKDEEHKSKYYGIAP